MPVSPVHLLSDADYHKCLRRDRIARASLRNGGVKSMVIGRLLHDNYDDAHERRSAVSGYEAYRAKLIVSEAYRDLERLYPGDVWFVTLGDPKLRLRPPDVGQFSPEKVLRRWRSGTQKLRALDLEIAGLCVVELQLCEALPATPDGEPDLFYEPHLHCVIAGASERQIKAAFKVRRDPTAHVRKRPLKVQLVYDGLRLMSYFTKFKPQLRKQYRGAEKGEKGWAKNRLPAEHLPDWYVVMSRFAPHQLLTSTGISLADLRKPSTAELATPFSSLPPRHIRSASPHQRSPVSR